MCWKESVDDKPIRWMMSVVIHRMRKQLCAETCRRLLGGQITWRKMDNKDKRLSLISLDLILNNGTGWYN